MYKKIDLEEIKNVLENLCWKRLTYSFKISSAAILSKENDDMIESNTYAHCTAQWITDFIKEFEIVFDPHLIRAVGFIGMFADAIENYLISKDIEMIEALRPIIEESALYDLVHGNTIDTGFVKIFKNYISEEKTIKLMENYQDIWKK